MVSKENIDKNMARGVVFTKRPTKALQKTGK